MNLSFLSKQATEILQKICQPSAVFSVDFRFQQEHKIITHPFCKIFLKKQ